MITGRVLSERVVSVSLSNGGLSQDVAQRKDIRFSSHRFKDFDAKTRSGKRGLGWWGGGVWGLHIDSV